MSGHEEDARAKVSAHGRRAATRFAGTRPPPEGGQSPGALFMAKSIIEHGFSQRSSSDGGSQLRQEQRAPGRGRAARAAAQAHGGTATTVPSTRLLAGPASPRRDHRSTAHDNW